jgi:hypothetical protein
VRLEEQGMTEDREVLAKLARDSLSGTGAHVELGAVFSGLDWKAAGMRPEGVPHSIYQLLNHIVFWQDWAIRWLDGKRPAAPRHASGSWPGAIAPANRKAWQAAVRRLGSVTRNLERRMSVGDILASGGSKSRLEMLLTIGAHNGYHVGQAALVRQTLARWPPPSGGLTW